MIIAFCGSKTHQNGTWKKKRNKKIWGKTALN